jgi:hypothetical protein
MTCLSLILTGEIAGIVDCCVWTVAEDIDFGDVVRLKVELANIFEVGSVCDLVADVEEEPPGVIWQRGHQGQGRKSEDGEEVSERPHGWSDCELNLHEPLVVLLVSHGDLGFEHWRATERAGGQGGYYSREKPRSSLSIPQDHRMVGARRTAQKSLSSH